MSTSFSPYEVASKLTPPPVPATVLELPKDVAGEWAVYDEIFTTVRDWINKFSDWIEWAFSWDIGTLPPGSLADVVITPFSGNWGRIRANGEACAIYAAGAEDLAEHCRRVPPAVVPVSWTGLGAVGFTAHTELYAVAMGAVADFVRMSKKVYDVLGAMAQKLGEAAIRVVVALMRLVKRITTQAARMLIGVWAKVEELFNGFEKVRWIFKGIEAAIHAIDKLIELKSLIETYAEQMRTELQRLARLPEMVAQIPLLGGGTMSDETPVTATEMRASLDQKVAANDPSAGIAAAGAPIDAAIDEADTEEHRANASGNDTEIRFDSGGGGGRTARASQ